MIDRLIARYISNIDSRRVASEEVMLALTGRCTKCKKILPTEWEYAVCKECKNKEEATH